MPTVHLQALVAESEMKRVQDGSLEDQQWRLVWTTFYIAHPEVVRPD